ncbi:MAG TPA: Type 1 glutamine amidotransferase-like domain-containing protein [Patescibacteria group bacterium]|nr:Type 1 glutamine amidotransferase-like domain-containing protein [Patescibacteria group bacterium]
MKLLLTSAGFFNKEVSDTFLSLLDKPTGQIHIIFIPTASRTEHELRYVRESRQELINLGITHITTLNLDHEVAAKEINNADVIYVCGGNTFYLLQKMRESGLDLLLPSFCGLYVGVSAGSIVVGPNVEVSGPWDDNDMNLSDTTGLKIVDFAVIPHYQRKDQAVVADLKNQANYEIMELTDNQAVLVENGEKTIIGLP